MTIFLVFSSFFFPVEEFDWWSKQGAAIFAVAGKFFFDVVSCLLSVTFACDTHSTTQHQNLFLPSILSFDLIAFGLLWSHKMKGVTATTTATTQRSLVLLALFGLMMVPQVFAVICEFFYLFSYQLCDTQPLCSHTDSDTCQGTGARAFASSSVCPSSAFHHPFSSLCCNSRDWSDSQLPDTRTRYASVRARQLFFGIK